MIDLRVQVKVIFSKLCFDSDTTAMCVYNLPTDIASQPLNAAMLAAASPDEQKQMIGERLFPLVSKLQPKLAGKITGMLLEMDNAELLMLLDSNEALQAKVEEAIAVSGVCGWVNGCGCESVCLSRIFEVCLLEITCVCTYI